MSLTGNLLTGKKWALVASATAAVTPEQGRHEVLVVPRIDGQTRDCLRRNELTAEEQAALFAIADRRGAELAQALGNPGYYRIEVNGPKAATQDHLHFHIIAGKAGTKFRRCVDSILAIPVTQESA